MDQLSLARAIRAAGGLRVCQQPVAVLAGLAPSRSLYEAFRNPDADHGELLGEIRSFADRERIALDNGYVTMPLTPLGAHELKPFMVAIWEEDYRRYRQSPEFRQRMRESGVYEYWRKAGFPKQCQPVEPNDFRCD